MSREWPAELQDVHSAEVAAFRDAEADLVNSRLATVFVLTNSWRRCRRPRARRVWAWVW